eukprot:2105844-Prymnesium_polylepis.1
MDDGMCSAGRRAVVDEKRRVARAHNSFWRQNRAFSWVVASSFNPKAACMRLDVTFSPPGCRGQPGSQTGASPSGSTPDPHSAAQKPKEVPGAGRGPRQRASYLYSPVRHSFSLIA